MTQLPPVVPTQEDREAAASLLAQHCTMSAQQAMWGGADNSDYVQAFARHRLASYDSHYLAQEVEAPASKGGEVDALREARALVALLDEQRAGGFVWTPLLIGPIHDALEALRAALLTPTESAGERRSLASQVIAYDDLLKSYSGPLSVLCSGDVAKIDAAYDALVAAALAASPTTPSASGAEIPAGMKPWSGGDSAPDDWDQGPVLIRSRIGKPYLADWTRNWIWTHGTSATANGAGDIVAYTPRAEQTGDGI